MKFGLAILVYLVLAAILGLGIYLTVVPNGNPWLLIVAVIGYTFAFVKFGCLDHH
jgi:hypothetical protein